MPQRSIKFFIRSIYPSILLYLMPQRRIKFFIIFIFMLYRSIEFFICSIEFFILLNLMFQFSTNFSISLHLSFKLLSESSTDRIRDGEFSFKFLEVGAGMLVLKS